MLNYKGYSGRVEFDDESGLLHGEVIDLHLQLLPRSTHQDPVTF